VPIIDYLKNEIQMSIPIVFDVKFIKFDQAGIFGLGFNISFPVSSQSIAKSKSTSLVRCTKIDGATKKK